MQAERVSQSAEDRHIWKKSVAVLFKKISGSPNRVFFFPPLLSIGGIRGQKTQNQTNSWQILSLKVVWKGWRDSNRLAIVMYEVFVTFYYPVRLLSSPTMMKILIDWVAWLESEEKKDGLQEG